MAPRTIPLSVRSQRLRAKSGKIWPDAPNPQGTDTQSLRCLHVLHGDVTGDPVHRRSGECFPSS